MGGVQTVRAPELVAGDWLNSEPLTLAGLRGRFVLLDFWTSCCGNCLHVLDELRALEAARAGELTVIGVHSPKFAHEASLDAVRAAVERYDVTHPVLNDPGLTLWRQYAVRAWPTLVLIDPDGYVVAHAAGEGQVSALAMLIDDLAPGYPSLTSRGGPAPVAREVPSMPLRYPAKAIALPGGTLLVADAGHHQIVELARDGETVFGAFGTSHTQSLGPNELARSASLNRVVRRFGSGRRGEPFAEPNGLTLLPDGDVIVADTANHVLRRLRPADGEVTTLDLPAALHDARTVTGPVPPVLSPWDVAWWPALGRLVVAAAGVHLLLSADPVTGMAEVLAGTTVEGLRDGPARNAWLAQPSGLAVDGDRVWFVDAETSALRYLTLDGFVRTAVGEGLFDFGHVDGPAGGARFQHPLGVTLLGDGTVAVLDTYNGAVRRYDPATDTVDTLARELAEPSGGLLVDGELVVVESAAHRLVRPVPRADVVAGDALTMTRPPVELAPGGVQLVVEFTPPPGRKLDDRYGPATALSVTASPASLLRAGAGEGGELCRALELAPGDGVLHVTAQAASCDDGGEHPACYLARQDWGVPVRVSDGGATELLLVLLG